MKLKLTLINAWLLEKEISDRSLVVAFMNDDVIYAITEVNGVIRLYRSDHHVPVVKTVEEALTSGLLQDVTDLIHADAPGDDMVIGEIGRDTLKHTQLPPHAPPRPRLSDYGHPFERYFPKRFRP